MPDPSGPALNEIDPDGLLALVPLPPLDPGWRDAILKAIAWAMGRIDRIDYEEGSSEVSQIKKSGIVNKLRAGFTKKNKGKKCKDWADYTEVGMKFGPAEFISDLRNGTAHFVGSANGDVLIDTYSRVPCKITAELTVRNVTSLRSFLYHLFPESWNIKDGGLPFSNWPQSFHWEETFNCEE
jgi:hypothetical protein